MGHLWDYNTQFEALTRGVRSPEGRPLLSTWGANSQKAKSISDKASSSVNVAANCRVREGPKRDRWFGRRVCVPGTKSRLISSRWQRSKEQLIKLRTTDGIFTRLRGGVDVTLSLIRALVSEPLPRETSEPTRCKRVNCSTSLTRIRCRQSVKRRLHSPFVESINIASRYKKIRSRTAAAGIGDQRKVVSCDVTERPMACATLSELSTGTR